MFSNNYFVLGLLYFLLVFIEMLHDWYRQTYVVPNSDYSFYHDRVSKIIKGTGIMIAIVCFSLSNEVYLRILWWHSVALYWVISILFSNPIYRSLQLGPKFVFSFRGFIWMINHSELIYWILILTKKAPIAELRSQNWKK